MATFECRDIIFEMLRNNGRYETDPPPHATYIYENLMNGAQLFAVFYQAKHFDLDVSPYVGEYVCLWSEELGLTPQGKKFLRGETTLGLGIGAAE